MRIARELSKSSIPVELLITVDAAESYWSDDIDRVIPNNVKNHYNIYQTDRGATFLKSYGGPNLWSGHKDYNSDQTGNKFNNEMINHSNIDQASVGKIIKWINDTLNK